MSAVLCDSSVLLDVATRDAKWGAWSESMLAKLAETSVLVINPIVYAEVSVGFARIEELDAALPLDAFRREPLPFHAGFSRARRSCATGAPGAHAPARYRTSTSAPTRPSRVIGCSRATPRASGPTFRRST